MFDWFRRYKNQKAEARVQESAMRLQAAYWRFDPVEKDRLLTNYPADLPWANVLRLHHLCCLELLETDYGRAMFQKQDGPPEQPDSPILRRCQELAGRLMSDGSPYRPQPAVVWQEPEAVFIGPGERREPDQIGILSNASLTHVGCLEAVHLDKKGMPAGIAFLPLTAIDFVVFHETPSLFRSAHIFFVDGQEEVVLVPLLYGTSWYSRNEYDQNGSMTRLICHVLFNKTSRGIGVGQQDLMMEGAEHAALFGVGSLVAISGAEIAPEET